MNIHLLDSMILGTIVVLLINVPFVLREINLRRLALARLRMAQTVTLLEKKMFDGSLKNGQLCHDFLFQVMRENQSMEKTPVNLFLIQSPSDEERRFHEQMHRELEADNELAQLIRMHVHWYYRAYRIQHPIASSAFALWVIFNDPPSFWVVVRSLFGALLKATKLDRGIQTYRELKDSIEEWLLTIRVKSQGRLA